MAQETKLPEFPKIPTARRAKRSQSLTLNCIWPETDPLDKAANLLMALKNDEKQPSPPVEPNSAPPFVPFGHYPVAMNHYPGWVAMNHPPAPNQCRWCLKEFQRRDHVVIHERSHTGEKPFFCPVDGCDKRYSSKSSLDRHVRFKHSFDQ